MCSVVTKKNIHQNWNNYIFDKYKTTLTTYNTYNTYNTLTTQLHIKMFNKIHDSEIKGRNLELFLPLFFISNFISETVFQEVLNIAKGVTKEKKHEEETESMDVMVYDFVSKQEEGLTYYSIKELVNNFRTFSDEAAEWLNSKWFGRALKRLNLVVDKRRKGYGMEVMLNVKKAKKQIMIFKK